MKYIGRVFHFIRFGMVQCADSMVSLYVGPRSLLLLWTIPLIGSDRYSGKIVSIRKGGFRNESRFRNRTARSKALMHSRPPVPAWGWNLWKARRPIRWYGRLVGDYPLPSWVKVEDLGKCPHAIRVPGAILRDRHRRA